jgi:hypothetical protein
MADLISPRDYLTRAGFDLEKLTVEPDWREVISPEHHEFYRRICAKFQGGESVSLEESLRLSKVIGDYDSYALAGGLNAFDKLSREILKLVHQRNPSSVLQVGAETGLYTHYLALNCPKTEFVAVDVDDRMARGFNDRKSLLGTKNTTQLTKDIFTLDESRKFPFILSIGNNGWINQYDLARKCSNLVSSGGAVVFASQVYANTTDTQTIKESLREIRGDAWDISQLYGLRVQSVNMNAISPDPKEGYCLIKTFQKP